MKENLEEIENWLRENANKIFEYSLQSPATKNEIKNLEDTIEKPLPNDFKELYLWHNGLNDEENFGSLFYGMDFLPIERIITEYLEKKENYSQQTFPLKKVDTEINPENINNINWIKFAFDGAHTGLYLDLLPNIGGKFGQVIFIDDEYETGILVASSTESLVANFIEDLENNRYYLAEDALEDDNHHLTTVPEIDIVNWESSGKWTR